LEIFDLSLSCSEFNEELLQFFILVLYLFLLTAESLLQTLPVLLFFFELSSHLLFPSLFGRDLGLRLL